VLLLPHDGRRISPAVSMLDAPATWECLGCVSCFVFPGGYAARAAMTATATGVFTLENDPMGSQENSSVSSHSPGWVASRCDATTRRRSR
jgi:hypothetical protein